MDAKAAKLAPEGLSYGAERIPDKVFESIPGHYFKPKEIKDRRGRHHRRSNSFSDERPSEPNTTSDFRPSASKSSRKTANEKMSRDHHSHSNGHGLYQKYYTTDEPSRRYDGYYAPEYQRGNQMVS